MRFLLSTVAAAALLATPALAGSPEIDDELTDAPAAADPATERGSLEQDLSGAGFADARNLHGAEMFRSTYQGEQAIVVVLPHEAGIAGAPGEAPAATGAIQDDFDDPAADEFGEADDFDDPAAEEFGEADDLDSPEATGAIEADPDTAETPGYGAGGVRGDLEAAGFSDARNLMGGQVLQTTTEDGRTMLVILAQDFDADSAMEPGAADPATDPALDPDAPEGDDFE